MEQLLFERLKLDKSLSTIKRPNNASGDETIATKYVENLLKEADEDLYEVGHYTGKAHQRLYIIHPDTEKSYLEIVTSFSKNNDKYHKVRYIVLGTNETYDSLKSDELDDDQRPPNINPLIKLKGGEAKDVLLYLAKKGMIFETTYETMNTENY